MKAISLVVSIGLSLSVVAGCDKNTSDGASATASATVNAAPAPAPAAAEVDCEKVVEKIASLNPADARGEPEKKLWRKMCADMKPAQKTCVLGAKDMDGMKGCMK